MKRVKVVSEPSDLVPLFRLFDTPQKRAVFRDVARDWHTAASVIQAHGPDGAAVLDLFEKAKIVETKWEAVDGTPQKSYRSYYTHFQIGFVLPVQDMSEIIGVASMPDADFAAIEQELCTLAEGGSVVLRAVSEKTDMPLNRLQCILKRSSRLDLRGHTIVRRQG